MAALSNSESRPQYSWWWDSHNIPKNSKWIQENLKEMDGKVKTMIKLIEEDADSFARRAEMYYKKRPELMKLVEDFYRAYRALAERYNHATGELRHAQRTIAKAFPNQVPPELLEDSPSKFLSQDRGPHTSELKGSSITLCESDDDSQSLSPSDIKNLSGSKGEKREKETELSKENENLRKKILHESERAEKYESEVLDVKKKLDDMQSDKENILVYYQKCLQKLAKIEIELDNAKLDSMGLTEKANQAETESQALKETLFQLEVEKNTRLVQLNEYLDKISNLEDMLCRAEEEMRGLDQRAVQAESEAQSVKTEISRLELEKEEVILQYKSHLGKISELEKIISLTEDEAKLLKKRAERSETEVCDLKRALADLTKEKEASSLQYQSYLEKILILENDLFLSEQDVSRLNKQMLTGNSKLKSAEEKCSILEMTNKSLRVEANNISKLIAMKDLEIHEKQEELEKLHTCLKNKHLHHAQIEATLKTLQDSHVQAQEDQKALSMELHALLQNLKDLELSKKDLEEENQMLSQTNLSSLASMENMLKEILSLCEIKEGHEKQVSYQMGLSESLQNEISCLKEEIQRLNLSYHALFQQAEDTSKLKQSCEDGSSEKAILLKKLVDLEKKMEEKVITESSFASMISELENSQERFKSLQECCRVLNGEKTATLSQLQAVTQNMHKLLERNAIIENSLLKANVEVEGLREKSEGLEDICELLKNERLHLLSERGNLALELESVEKRLESLEKRCTGLEEKYADVEKEKKVIHTQVKELEISLARGKEENSRSRLERETRLTGLENEIQLLKEENKWKEKESEEELEKALKSQFEISILQKFIKEMEEKNFSLIIECQKHVEASNLADKLISELESESFEQQVESERLLDEIERLRLAIYNVFRSLESGVDFSQCENEGAFVNHMLEIIENMKFSVARNEEDKQLLLVQNSVLLTMLEQFESKGMETESQKVYLEKELSNTSEELFEVKTERDKLADMNRCLRSDVIDGHKLAATFEAELRDLCSKQDDLRKCYNVLQEMYTQVTRDNESLLKKCSDLNEDKILEDQVYEAILVEYLATNNELMVVKNFGDEKVKELKSLSDDLIKQHELNCVFEREIRALKGKMDLQKAENLVLKDSVLDLESKVQDIKESNKLVLFETNLTLEAAENLNSILCGTVDELKMEIQDSLKIRENLEKSILRLNKSNSSYKNEVGRLRIVNTNLSSEIGLLREEIIEQIASEQSLSLELDGKNHEFEMLEAEGSAFYFHLQVSSSVREVLFENKVKELIGVCKALENERVSKNIEIEQMKGKFSSMEREINGLRSQMSAYCPVVACLEEDISSFERSFFQTKRKALNQEALILERTSHPTNCEMFQEDQTLLSLMNLRARVKAVGKKMEGTNLSDTRRRSNSATKQEYSLSEIESSKLGRTFSKNKHDKNRKNGMLMKDIPLDQVSGEFQKRGNTVKEDRMLDDGMTIGESLRRSFKTKETDIVYDHLANMKHKSSPPSTDSDIEKEFAVVLGSQLNEGANDRKIFDRLKSDAQKLETLQITVHNLMSKLEMNRKGKNSKSVDFETVSEQLLEAEETVLHLLNLNGELVKDIEQCPSPNSRASVQLKEAVMTKRRKVMEQARKGSERIERLELEIKKIECMLLTDDKKNKARNMFFKNKTIILRDFIYNGRKKNDSLCRCFKSSTSRNGSISP